MQSSRVLIVLFSLVALFLCAVYSADNADANTDNNNNWWPSRPATPSNTPSRTSSHSVTPSKTPTHSVTSSKTPTHSVTHSITPSHSITPTYSPCPGENRQAILQQKVRKVYTNLVYPTSTYILAGAVTVTDLFAPDVRGRVDPVGTFDSFLLLTEYFYALAANPSNMITSVDITDIFGQNNEVFVRVNVFFQATNPNTTKSFNLTQSGRYLFNDDDLIQLVDVTIHYLGKTSNPPEIPGPYSPQQMQLIQGICYTLTTSPGTCANATLDPEGHYSNVGDCIVYFMSIPYGTWDDAEANSVVCRQLHTILTFFDPVTHCPHTGKTGGGKCVDWPYEEYATAVY